MQVITAVSFGWCAILSLFDLDTHFDHPLVLCMALFTAVCSMAFRLDDAHPRRSVALLLLHLGAAAVIVSASGGIHSPLLSLFFVFTLECGVWYGEAWGWRSGALVAGAVSAIVLLDAAHVSLVRLDDLVACYPFFLTVGWLAGGLADERRELRVRQRAAEYEMELARSVQEALLPQEVPSFPGYDVVFRVLPQKAVGGDLVQFIVRDSRLGCVIADASGKGVPAAIVATTLHHLIQGLRQPERCDGAIKEINTTLSRCTPMHFCATLVLVWAAENGDLEYANAGHPAPLVYRSSGVVEVLPDHGLVAGWVEDSEYQTARAHLAPGDILVLYSDGLS
ncbi:MAG: PP2C family protein-serine/threonine phosphatase, partial [Candidatus Xenobia bacterium]